MSDSERVSVFKDVPSAQRAISNAKANGFDNVHVVTEDPAVLERLESEIKSDEQLVVKSQGSIALILGLVGAAVGLVVGFGAALFWSPTGSFNGVLPGAGLLFGGFIGAMCSRAFTHPARVELGAHEMMVTIEASAPDRLAVAKQILDGRGPRGAH